MIWRGKRGGGGRARARVVDWIGEMGREKL